IVDQDAWNTWLSQISGSPKAEVEVVHRTLRARDQNAPAKTSEDQANVGTAPWAVQPRVGRHESAPAATSLPAKDEEVDEAAVSTGANAATVPPKAEAQPATAGPVQAAKASEITAAQNEQKSIAPPAGSADGVKQRILALVVEKTGYPADMLDPDLDLEADLGVDTVKQAEMFAAIREIYNIPRDENRKLRDYPTLAHVIRFVYEKRPDLKQATIPTVTASVAGTAASVTATPAATMSNDPIKDKVLQIVAEKTGYPPEMLDLDLDLEADLGIDTVKQAEMFAAVRAAYNIPRDENLKLRDFPTLASVIKFAHDRAQLGATTVITQPEISDRAAIS